MSTGRPENDDIAAQLDEAAELLAGDDDGRRRGADGAGSDRWRARAYREAARTIRELREPVTAILARDGREGLLALPAIGPAIAKRIEDMAYGVEDGEQLALFPPARSEAAPPEPSVAREPRRAVRDLFESQIPIAADPRPPIGLLLHLDARFREHVVAADRVERTSGEWLPTWQVKKGGFAFTVRFSTSARAQQLGRTHDWVVLEHSRDGVEDQATVVTEYRGPLTGRRVVRGRERECLSYWARETERRREAERWNRAG